MIDAAQDPSDRAFGRCDLEARVLYVHVSAHPNDREVRATLLHEMVHVIAGPGGHNARFWTELEYLLSRGAPITVGFPELGERGTHLAVIPARFERCRKLFAHAYEKQQRAIRRMATGLDEHQYTPHGCETESCDWAIDGVAWRDIWAHHCRMFGFVELDGNMQPDARPYYEAILISSLLA